MEITKALREHLAKQFNVAEDASDTDISQVIAEKMISGELTPETVKKFSVDEDAEKAFNDRVAAEVAKQIKALAPAGNPDANTPEPAAPVQAKSPTPAEVPAPTATEKAFADLGVAGGDGSSADDYIRVKGELEKYDGTRTKAAYGNTEGGRRASLRNATPTHNGQTVEKSSERDLAIAGAWFKRMALPQLKAKGIVDHRYELPEHEKNIITATAHESRFVGPFDYSPTNDGWGNAKSWANGDRLNDWQIKALLSDSTSGGLEAVPIEFDSAVIMTPVLQGEVFPRVNVRRVTRPRQEAAAMVNPTWTWGTAEGTAIAIFDTAAFISAFDNTIYPVTGAIELGRDFLADSPVEVGRMIQTAYGNTFRKELDDVTANGNGTNQPQGVFNASGTGTVNSAGGAGQDPEVGDYEGLHFGVAKEFRSEAGRSNMSYIGTDTSYSRARGIVVGSGDERRVFGMDQANYRIFDYDYAVNESAGNAKIGFVCWNRYRMYQIPGYEFRTISEDKELALKNQVLYVLRGRFGGALELGGAMAKISDAKA